MTISDFIIENTRKLSSAGCDAPRTDVIAILEDCFSQDRSWILAHDDENIKKSDLSSLTKMISLRVKHQPLAYILGHKEFYGRKFDVTQNVLIPRPESESIIELAKELKKSKHFLDIGTGSGCLATTLALEIPGTKVMATDTSLLALEIAQANCQSYGAAVDFTQSDLLASLPDKTWTKDLTVVANLPYVPDELITSPEITTEPKLALFGGSDGMDIYRNFWQQIENLSTKPKYIITESLESQHMKLALVAAKAGYQNTKTLGLAQLFTV